MRKTSSLPNSIADSTAFPFGAIQDKATGVTGTPVIEATYSDFIQNLWHFVAVAGITPNGLQDNVTNGFQLAKALQVVLEPVGSVRYWLSSASIPVGFVVMDGRSLSKTTYPDLWALIGYNYGGSGDNFNIPNSVDKFIVGAGGAYAVGANGGSPTVMLSASNIPSLNVPLPVGRYGTDDNNFANQFKFAAADKGSTATDQPSFNFSLSAKTDAGSTPHNNLPPYLAATPLIKIQYV